jgi:hypothetical protein
MFQFRAGRAKRQTMKTRILAQRSREGELCDQSARVSERTSLADQDLPEFPQRVFITLHRRSGARRERSRSRGHHALTPWTNARAHAR